MNKISDERIKHMHGVAEYMYRNAEKYGLNADKMYLLGLLHDIGYIYGKEEHEANGSRLLNELGYEGSDIISWHGTTPIDYMRLTGYDFVPAELAILWEADMSVDLNGKEVGFDARLSDIGTRHGLDSLAYSTSKETIEWLNKNMKLYFI